ncbi:MAG: AAA family ATPase [Pirellula sp.]
MNFLRSINTLVGANDTGKSTLIEAINLALMGRVHGKALALGMSPYLINLDATREYVNGVIAATSPPPIPPTMTIEIYLEESIDTAILRGTNNLYGEDACWFAKKEIVRWGNTR